MPNRITSTPDTAARTAYRKTNYCDPAPPEWIEENLPAHFRFDETFWRDDPLIEWLAPARSDFAAAARALPLEHQINADGSYTIFTTRAEYVITLFFCWRRRRQAIEKRTQTHVNPNQPHRAEYKRPEPRRLF